jgi:hypothetical protein
VILIKVLPNLAEMEDSSLGGTGATPIKNKDFDDYKSAEVRILMKLFGV